MSAKSPDNNDKIVSFQKAGKSQKTHEILSQNPYYKFIHSLLNALESAGLPLDKPATEKALELYAKYQRENQLAIWQQALQEKYVLKQQTKNDKKPVLKLANKATEKKSAKSLTKDTGSSSDKNPEST